MKLTYNDTSHSYWLDGKRVKSASKVAKIAADSFSIEQWSKRMVAVGMTLDRALIERVAVDLDNKKAIQEVCDDASKTAKAHTKAERGSQRHRAFELVLLGRDDQFITDQQRADAIVLKRTLDAYGLEPIPDRVEQFVAWPEHDVVGRYDAIVAHEGRPVGLDLKSGINAVKYPHSTLVQGALYFHAPHTSRVIERGGDKSTVTEWTTMPDDIDRECFYILHCDDEHEIGDLYRMDLGHGLVGATLALNIVRWRKGHKYGDEAVTKIEAGATPAVATEPEAPPPPARTHIWDFPAKSPPPDEGAGVDKADVAALEKRYGELSQSAKAWTGALVGQGNKGHAWRIRETPTVRRYELYRGAMMLAEWGTQGSVDTTTLDDCARVICHRITKADEALFPTTPPGLYLATLSAAEAARFANGCQQLTQGRFSLIYEEDGTPRLAVA